MRKIFLLFFVMLGLSIAVHAQNRTITGVVTGKTDNQPLIGVTISVKGSQTATSTDVNGKFSIKVTNLQNVVLSARYIGYEYQEVTVKQDVKTVDFQLVATNSSLNEVVVTGYGTTLKSKLLGAVGEIKAADVVDLPVANLGTALVNRLPGIGVSVASGKPGAPTTISIRNPTTFSGGASLGITSNPLYVIDGLIATIDDFNNLDASLVESISFLKDSQAAIYGAAGDKGVVLVTTKKGKPGKARVTYNGYYGTSDVARAPSVLNGHDLAQFLNDTYAVANQANNVRFSQADLDFLATNPYKSWYDELWHPSILTRHTINVSGGTDKITFFGGGSYYDEGGNYGTISVKKYNIRSGMTAKVSDEVTAFISLNTNYNTTYRNTLKGSNTNTEDLMTKAIFLTPGWVPLTINGSPNNWAQSPNPPGAWNPLALFNSGDYETNANQGLNLNSSLEYRPKFVRGLTLKVQYGKNNNSGTAKQYFPSYTVYNFNRSGQNSLFYTNVPTASPTSKITNTDQLSLGTSYTNNYELITSADYARTIGKHTFDALFVVEQTESSGDSYATFRTGQLIPNVDQFYAYNTTTTTIQNPQPVESGKRSYLGTIKYDFSNKYLVQLIGRVDGSANFPPDKRWGFFPSVGLGWRVSEEKWFKDHLSKYVNSLKLRGNMGLVGDDRIQGYQYRARFTQTTGALFGTNVTNGLDPNIFPNPNITWEKARTSDYGLDATFLNDRLTLGIDIWNRHTYDGFQDYSAVGLPYTVGITTALQNYGIQNNWGTEFTLGWLGTVSKDWHYDVNVNFGTSNSQLIQAYVNPTQLGTDLEYQTVQIGETSNKYTSSNYGLIAKGIIRNQAQLDAILAKNPNYKIEGKTPQVGWMDFEDNNHDGVITAAGDAIPMYSSVSPIIGFGVTFGVSYKTFHLSVNGNLTIGGKVSVDGDARKLPATNQSAAAFWNDHWTPSNPNATYPRYDSPDISENSTFWTRSGTSSRINNMSLSYGLPKSIADRLKIPDLRIMVSGTNLWSIINPYDYKDQNTSSLFAYPTLRTFSFGLNVTL